jgi:hypothetical protein
MNIDINRPVILTHFMLGNMGSVGPKLRAKSDSSSLITTIVAERLTLSWSVSFNLSLILLDYQHTLLGELLSPLFRECSAMDYLSQR